VVSTWRQASVMPHGYEKDVDLNGYKRGAHQDGEEVCKQYEFTVPGYDGTVWGWNDVRGFNCKACGRLATEHVVIEEPKILEMPKRREPVAPPSATVEPAVAFDPHEDAERYRARAAEYEAKYEAGDMLDEMNDPLAVNARPKPKPPPPPPQQLPKQPQQPPQSACTPAHEALSAGDAVEQARRDAEYNEAFKREVERMVREKPNLAASAQQPEVPPALVTVPKDTFRDAAALLASVNLPQYTTQFEEEEMDPTTLIEVLDQQGKAALDEALKELGIKSMGHRLKIINSMLVT